MTENALQDLVVNRIKALKATHERLMAQVHANLGAMNELEQLAATFAKKNEPGDPNVYMDDGPG